MQLRQLGFQLGNPFRLNTPDDQFVTAVFNGLMRKLSQPGMQTLAHFTGGFFGEGDGQDVLRLHAIQQGPNDPGHQHPGLASPRTRFNHHAALRVAGDLIKQAAINQLVVDLVGRSLCTAHAATSCW
jgi:hypothetical protein